MALIQSRSSVVGDRKEKNMKNGLMVFIHHGVNIQETNKSHNICLQFVTQTKPTSLCCDGFDATPFRNSLKVKPRQGLQNDKENTGAFTLRESDDVTNRVVGYYDSCFPARKSCLTSPAPPPEIADSKAILGKALQANLPLGGILRGGPDATEGEWVGILGDGRNCLQICSQSQLGFPSD